MTAIGSTRLWADTPHAAAGTASFGNEQRLLLRAVRALNEQNVLGPDNVLTISFDGLAERPILRIVTRATHELVLQLPSEWVLQQFEQLRRHSQ